MEKMTRKERILFALHQIGIDRIDQMGEQHGSAQYAALYRQIFSNNEKFSVTIDMVSYLCNKFPQLSYEYIIDGTGPWERTKIVTPPTNRQDIHIAEGATAAISQSGSASATPVPAPADEKKSDTFTYEDVARMVRDNDLGGLVGIIFAQQQTIIRYEQQRNADLIREMRIIDDKLFPDVH